MESFYCDYLQAHVELTTEREIHIADHHPDLLPLHKDRIAATLADPDQVRRSTRFGNARLFSRIFTDFLGGKHVVVVVVTEVHKTRHWIATAYIARKLVEGEIEWAKN